MKNFFKIFVSAVLCTVILLGILCGGFFIFYTPSLTADFSQKTGAVTAGASGYLYGIAEPGVPSENMTESIDISTVSQKVTGGLQHPVGDIDHIYSQLANTDYNVVYLQDAYSTWYYEQDNIEKMRSENKYDWKSFIEEDYLPKVEKSVKQLSASSYGDKIVYCLYNECDNGVWFGEDKKSEDSTYGVYGEYNARGAQNFFEAWKITYELVKSINPDALIGGPGFCDYDSAEIRAFMEYCSKNNCLPEIMIYHELGDGSVYHWQEHVEDYRILEEELGVGRLPIIVTEYGRMQDNGMPGKMLQYITQIESSKVYADNAFWRLANNLCDVAADDNCPNSNWWLYRWYADLEGQTVKSSYQDLFKSNFGKAISGEAEFSSQGFMGIATVNDDESKIEILCGGRNGSATVKLKNLDSTALFGKPVSVTVEEVKYAGISGVVNSPTVISKSYYEDLEKRLTVDMNGMDESSAYHIIIEAESNIGENYKSDDFSKRFEFEEGELLGNAYTYDSAYATTGEKDGMVGGMENDGDGVRLKFTVSESGLYDLNIIFGNSNDGEWDENSKQNPNDRTYSYANISLDGNPSVENVYDNGESTEILTQLCFPNTIKSEYTDCKTITLKLEKGEHTLELTHNKGTLVYDSLLVEKHGDESTVYVLNDADRTTDSVKSYLVVAAYDGYYSVSTNGEYSAEINENSVNFVNGENTVYLMRGLNYIDIENGADSSIEIVLPRNEILQLDGDAYTAGKLKLSGSATLGSDRRSVDYVTGISSDGGRASLKFNAESAGTYAVTIEYANNDEGGKHAYNVDLIERYVTVTAGGKSQDIFCRSTYSWDTYKTVTCYVDLKKGSNTITFTNSGNYKFDGQTSYAPNIASVSVNRICK